MVRRSSTGRARSRAIDIVEGAYALQGSDEDWLRGVAQHILATHDEGLGIGAYIVDVRDSGLEIRSFCREGNAPSVAVMASTLRDAPSQEFVVRAHLRGGLSTTSEAFKAMPEILAHADSLLIERFGVRDTLTFLASDGVRTTSAFSVGLPRRRKVAAHECRFWGRLGSHVAAGLRLRERLAINSHAVAGTDQSVDVTQFGEAIFDGAGRLLHSTGAATGRSPRDRLRTAVMAADKARGKLRKRDPEAALELWRGMVDGRWTLVDHFDTDGRRFVVACENLIDIRSPRQLSDRERQVAHLIALGRSNAQVAYELGMSASTVSVHLRIALRKLGFESRAKLCDAWTAVLADQSSRIAVFDEPERVHALSVRRQQPPWFAQLSSSEVEVAEALLEGCSNAQIAKARGTSLRTVENQVASILCKVGVQSRGELSATQWAK